ncbi:MAG: glycerol-3-phosphate 1-O-acyltransferase PlsY [Oscillospiraceae bacterium]|nr:glycerol-3-phosphate 1-O-acyltransferase PlsY [Oscillospiraceae bacterium]
METLALVCVYVTSIAAAYLLGSVNSAIIVTGIISKKQKDIRDLGSKNAGMTNVLRNFGIVPAIITLLGDFGKGILAVVLGRLVYSFFTDGNNIVIISYLCAVFVILGHIFPVFYKFKGGKGILTSTGMIAVIDPLVCALIVSIFLVLIFITRYVSLSNIFASISYPIFTTAILISGNENAQTIAAQAVFTCSIAALLVFMHRENIKRLIHGTESRIGDKKS